MGLKRQRLAVMLPPPCTWRAAVLLLSACLVGLSTCEQQVPLANPDGHQDEGHHREGHGPFSSSLARKINETMRHFHVASLSVAIIEDDEIHSQVSQVSLFQG